MTALWALKQRCLHMQSTQAILLRTRANFQDRVRTSSQTIQIRIIWTLFHKNISEMFANRRLLYMTFFLRYGREGNERFDWTLWVKLISDSRRHQNLKWILDQPGLMPNIYSFLWRLYWPGINKCKYNIFTPKRQSCVFYAVILDILLETRVTSIRFTILS